MSSATAHARALGVSLLPSLLLIIGCAKEPEPIDTWRVEGRAASIADLLERLEGFEQTPAARWASAARSSIGACGQVVAEAGTLGELDENVRCADELGLEQDLAWTLEGPAAGGFVEAKATERGDQTRVEVTLSGALDLDGGAASLLPRSEDVGPPRFGGPLLVHGRFGADGGLDPASWIQEGTAGDRLFGLRSRLFSGALLTGVWEIAAPAPAEGEAILPLVFALETRSRRALEAAVKAFADTLRSSWGLEPRPATLPAADGVTRQGSCYEELRVLPAFRPCWTLVDRALVVGWNVDALTRALTTSSEAATSEPTAGADEEGHPSRLDVHLDRFPAADLVLARATLAPSAGGEATVKASSLVPGPYPWSRWTVEGRREGDEYRIVILLQP